MCFFLTRYKKIIPVPEKHAYFLKIWKISRKTNFIGRKQLDDMSESHLTPLEEIIMTV